MPRGKNLIIIGLVCFLVAGATVALYAVTRNQILGPTPMRAQSGEQPVTQTVSIDTILFHAKEDLPPTKLTKLSQLEKATNATEERGRTEAYRQLASYWADSLKMFAPYAWYTAEAARLENSEKSLTFAAHLFLNSLTSNVEGPMKQWGALQAKDLFERSLKLNPRNDSSKVALGAVYLYGGIDMPMKGITMIREVANADSTNAYAQITLGEASLMSGQLDKGLERFRSVARMHPDNLEAIIRAGETAEQMSLKKEAVEWYRRSLPLITASDLKYEVRGRITELEKQINK